MSFDNLVFDPTERLRILADSISGEIGIPFLEKLSQTLNSLMEADVALITLGEDSGNLRARAIFALKDGAPVENIEYALEGTPCRLVYDGDTIVIPCNLSDRFPREKGFSGYVGVPLRNAQDAVIGHISVFSEHPIRAPGEAEAVVQICAARVEADLRYQKLEQDRKALIAELEHANETLKGRNQALHDANQSKTLLMGMMAHDLRNPLAAIVAQNELLQTLLKQPKVDVDKVTARTKKIEANADRLKSNIDAALIRSRSDNGKLLLQRRRCNVSTLVIDAIETNAKEALRKSVSVKFGAATTCWASLDDGLCLEAIDNLISNAIKYSDSNTEVTVCVEQSNTEVTIKVKDQGQGLSEEDMRKVFQPFQKLSSQPTCGESSTGLGLANVQAVAEAHGGKVRVRSAGKSLGAVFELVLPIHDGVATDKRPDC